VTGELSPQRLALLGKLLHAEGIDAAPARAVPRRADPTAPVPLTFGQNRLWFLEQLAGHASAYVISAALKVHGDFRLEVFAAACGEVVRRHESLRTVFVEDGGATLQLVRDDLAPDLRIVDVRAVDGRVDVEEEILRREAELVTRPFDLARGPLLRGELLRLGPQESAVLLNLHHLVCDRWSMGVLLRELIACYTALLTRRPIDLPELEVQYPDFAEWLARSASAAAAGPPPWQAELDHWERRLRGIPLDVHLPTDRPRPQQKTYRGSSVPVSLPPAVVGPLRELARAEGTTPFMVLDAVFAALVGRLGGSDDVVVGTPVANRRHVELEPLIGFFVNTLALRADLSGDPTFRQLLRRVRATCLEAYEHQDVPFERLVEVLAPQRSLARTPIFQVMLSYQNVPLPTIADAAIRVEPVSLPAGKAEFDLLLDLFEDGDTIWGRLEYSVDLFDRPTAQRYADLFLRLVRDLVAEPDRRLGERSLLTDDELRLARERGSGPARDRTATPLPHDAVTAHARRDPRATALVHRGHPTTYGSLSARAAGWDGALRELGAGRGSVVTLALSDPADLATGLLAVLRSGAAAAFGSGAEFGDDAGAGLLLTDRETLARGGLGVGLVPVLVDDLPDGPGADAPEAAVRPKDPALVLDTGVVTHAEVRDTVAALQEEVGLDGTDRVLHLCGGCGSAAVRELLWPLASGAAVVAGDRHDDGDSFDVAGPGPDGGLAETLMLNGVTTALLDSDALDELVQDRALADCLRLRRVVCTGDAPSEGVVELFAEASTAVLVPLLGPDGTAGAIGVVVSDGPHRLLRTLPGLRLVVLDGYGRPAGIGVTGGLHLVPPADAAAPRPTGELARYRADLTVELLGREHDQVELHGERIDLAAVARALQAHPQVRQAVVVPAGPQPDAALIAYLVADHAPSPAELAALVRRRLPEAAVPVAFLAVPRIPRTPSGEPDVAALPRVDPAAADRSAAYVAPRTDTERTVADLWRELLSLDRVGVDDSFFELGGHSLLATQLLSRIETATGFRLTVRELFDHPTVAGLATLIARGPATTRPTTGVATDPGGPGELTASGALRAPLAPAQELRWRHHPVPPEDAYHNVVTAVTLTGELDDVALARALDALVRRHAPLRTRFVAEGDRLFQEVDPSGHWPLQRTDLRGLDADAQQVRLTQLVADRAGHRFALAQQAAILGDLVTVDDGEHVLVLVMHHLVTDNWSYGVLVRDLCEFYRARVSQERPVLPALRVPYPQLSEQQQRELASPAVAPSRAYWRAVLAELPQRPTLAPPPVDGPPPQQPAGTSIGFRLQPGTSTALAELARAESASLFMVLMAGLHVLLGSAAGRNDIVVAFPHAGRDRGDSAQLVGYLVNDLVVRTDLDAAPTFRALVRAVRTSTLAAYQHAAVPVRSLPEVRDPDRDPFRIVLNLLNAEVGTPELPGVEITPWTGGAQREYVFDEVAGALDPRAVDLALMMREHPDGLRGMWLFSPERLPASTAAALAAVWPRLLERITTEPDVSLGLLRDVLAPRPTPTPEPDDGATTGRC
jgi:non-ribosomal peptide synthetase component F/acyl carrier protein